MRNLLTSDIKFRMTAHEDNYKVLWDNSQGKRTLNKRNRLETSLEPTSTEYNNIKKQVSKNEELTIQQLTA